MKRRDGKGTTSTDLLVCFPTRAHLTLMPKTICSPSRPSGPNKNTHSHQQYGHQVHHLRKSSRGGSSGRGGGGGHASPYLWSKTKQVGSDYSEPTSPKVTCSGQIKVRPRPGCKNWQSVMEEIERLHSNKQKKKPTWVEALGFKKEIMQFLTCLRSVKLDFQCFGSFPNANITSDDDEDDQDEDEDEDDQENQQKLNDQEDPSRAVFSKWFMVLQEDQNPRIRKEESSKVVREIVKPIDDPPDLPCAPPPNALFLMRCRSAPAKSWQEEQEEEEEEEENDDDSDHEEVVKKKLEEELQVLVMEEEEMEMEKGKKKKRESLEELMRYETDFYKFSCDIAKETWVVGGIKDVLSRSRSSKR